VPPGAGTVSAAVRQQPGKPAPPHGGEPGLDFRPASRERWTDVEQVLGRRGGHDGCWCMRWRVPAARFRHPQLRGRPGRQ